MSGSMTTENASAVKKKGHSEEVEFANSINGTVVNGTTKIDVIGENGEKYQLKRGKRYQWALYSNKAKIDNVPHLAEIFASLIDNEEEKDKAKKIENQKTLMKKGVEILQDKNNLKEFLDYMIFANEENLQHRFNLNNEVIFTNKKDLLEDLVNCDVVSSRGDRKIILKKKNNIIEIEVRSDKKSILLVSTSKNLQKQILQKNENYVRIMNEN